MQLGVSNLMWAPEHDDAVARVLARCGVDRIDIAPSRYFPPAISIDPCRLGQVREAWAARGVTIAGMQSLLHGGALPDEETPALFGSAAGAASLDRIIRQRIAQAAALGVTVLIFGSWQNRRRGDLGPDAARALACRRLRALAEAAAAADVILAVEPIHHGYGNDFLVDHDEAARLVAAVDHPGFGLVLDVGCAGLAGEDLSAVLERHGNLVRHVQLAEQGLAPLADSAWHREAGPVLARWLSRRAGAGLAVPGVCIEALSPPASDPSAVVSDSIELARRWYS